VEPRNIARTTSDDAKSSSVGSPEAGARVRILPGGATVSSGQRHLLARSIGGPVDWLC
jgi:hypothetical protein